VLVVDDDPDFTAIMAALLSRAGFVVDTANDADQAVRLARGTSPDLITLDVELPDRPGPVILDELRRHAGLAEVPVLVISGLPAARGRARFARVQGRAPAAFLEKPSGLAFIVGLVRQLTACRSE